MSLEGCFIPSSKGHSNPGTWWLEEGKHHIHPEEVQEGGSRGLQSSESILSPQKDYGPVPSGRHVHTWRKRVTGNSQHGFFMGKSCLINLIAVSDKMTGYHSLLFSTGAYLECCPGFWLPSSWKTSTYWNEVSGGPPSRLGDRITWSTGKSWEKRICSAVKKEG